MALILVVTAQSMASARTMTTPTGEMVLCTGTGPIVVSVDAGGNPTGPAHICPDCAMSILDIIAAEQGVSSASIWFKNLPSPAIENWAYLLHIPDPTARAPPASG